MDKKQEEIVELQKTLQKAQDEVTLRKNVIESMQENLIKHENESMQMS